MDGPPVEIYIKTEGIEVFAYSGPDDVGSSGPMALGDSWRVGAIDKTAFPYEVLIVVVSRSK